MALPQRAAVAFPTLESTNFTGTGFYQQAAPKGRQASAVNTGVMAVAKRITEEVQNGGSDPRL